MCARAMSTFPAVAYQLEIGTPVHIVAGPLGHASPATTLSIYAAFLPTADRDASTGFGTTLNRLIANSQSHTNQHAAYASDPEFTNQDKGSSDVKVRPKRAPTFENSTQIDTTRAHSVDVKLIKNKDVTAGDDTEIVPPSDSNRGPAD